MMLSRVFTISGILMLAAGIAACQPEHQPARQIFDDAEVAYKAGKYGAARNNYTLFLKLNPDSQLERLAKRRLMAIDREIENVMGQKTGPRPVYAATDSPSALFPEKSPQIFKSENAAPPPQKE